MPDQEQKLKSVYLANRDDLFSYLKSMVRDSSLALDLLHDAYLNLFRRYGKGTLPDDLSCRKLLFTIARNLVINEGEKYYNRKVHLTPVIAEVAGDSASAENDAFRGMDRAALRAVLDDLLDRLEETDRTILLLRYESDFKLDAIADIVNLSISAVSRRLDSAKKKLIEEGRKAGFDPSLYL